MIGDEQVGMSARKDDVVIGSAVKNAWFAAWSFFGCQNKTHFVHV
jgi:hypothetical protein